MPGGKEGGKQEPWLQEVDCGKRSKPSSIPICLLAGGEGGGHMRDILILAL